MVEYLPLVLTGLGLTASILYYALVLRNQNKMMKTQMFMNLYATYSSPEFRRRYNDISFNVEYDNYNDFWEKYGPVKNPEAFAEWTSVAAFFEGMGLLVKKRLIDIENVHDLLGSVIIDTWEKMGRAILESREIHNIVLWQQFEYLYGEMKKLNP